MQALLGEPSAATPDAIAALFAECEAVAKDLAAAARPDAALAMAMLAVQTAGLGPDDAATARLVSALLVQDTMDPPDPRTGCAVALPLARAWARKGRFDEALAVLDERRRRGGVDRFHAPILDAERAVCQRAMGRPAEALNALAEAESGLRDREARDPIEFHRITRCEVLGERGQVFLDLGRPDLAAPNFELESDLAAQIGDPTTRFSALLHRIHLEFARERCDRAIARIDAAAAEPWLAALGASGAAMLEVRRALAMVREAIDDPSRIAPAREAARRAADLATQGGILALDDRIAAQLAVARIERIAGDPSAAARSLAEAAVIAREAGAEGRVRAERVAAELALALAIEGDSAALARERDSARATLEDMLAEWDRAPRLESGLGFFQFHSRCELVVETMRAMAALDRSEAGRSDAGIRACFDVLLEVDARSRLSGGSPTSLAALREHVLRDGDLLLAWLPAAEKTVLFVVTRDSIELFECEGVSRLRAAGDALTESFEANSLLGDQRRALFARFVPEAVQERVAGSRRLLLYGLDIVGPIPFEAAIGRNGEPLGLSFGMTRLSSLAWAARKAATPETSREFRSVHVLAPTIGPRVRAIRPDLEPLTPEHARAAEFATLGGVVIVGEKATFEAMHSQVSTPTRWLSILTHGALDPMSARPGRLILAPSGELDPGWFDCAAAESLPACDVVFLAACRSAVGPMRRGDAGATDLAGALLFGGVRVVVAAAGDVRASYAARLAIDTERLARQGISPCEALSSARRFLLDGARPEDRAERERAAFDFRVSGLGHFPLSIE